MNTECLEKDAPDPIAKLFNLNERLHHEKFKNDKPLFDPLVPCIIMLITSIQIFLNTSLQILSTQIERHESISNCIVFFFQFLFQYTKFIFFLSSVPCFSPENKILIKNSLKNIKESLSDSLSSLTPIIYSINKDFIDEKTSSIEEQLINYRFKDDDNDNDDDDDDNDTQEL